MRSALIAATMAVGVGVALVVAGAASRPLSTECSPGLEPGACQATVSAVLRRGLPALHPLILSASVEPGSAPRSQDLGHRATVTFELLGVPGPTRVELHYDLGGHWGGNADRSDEELAAWTFVPLLVVSLLALGIMAAVLRRRVPPTAP